jgi:hypothetical protein
MVLAMAVVGKDLKGNLLLRHGQVTQSASQTTQDRGAGALFARLEHRLADHLDLHLRETSPVAASDPRISQRAIREI